MLLTPARQLCNSSAEGQPRPACVGALGLRGLGFTGDMGKYRGYMGIMAKNMEAITQGWEFTHIAQIWENQMGQIDNNMGTCVISWFVRALGKGYRVGKVAIRRGPVEASRALKCQSLPRTGYPYPPSPNDNPSTP